MTDIERLKAAHLEAIDKGGEEYGLQYQQTIMEAATACTAVSVQYAIEVLEECYFKQGDIYTITWDKLSELKQQLETLKH